MDRRVKPGDDVGMGDALQQWLMSFSPAHALEHAVGGGSSLSLTFFLGIFVLSSMTIVLALHTILAEE